MTIAGEDSCHPRYRAYQTVEPCTIELEARPRSGGRRAALRLVGLDCPPAPVGAYVNCWGHFVNPVYEQEGDQIVCEAVTVTGRGCPQPHY